MVSIQRLQELAECEQETVKENGVSKDDTKVQLKGHIEFKDVEMRYKANLDPALKDLSFSIQ